MNKRVREIEVEAANCVNNVYLKLHAGDEFIWNFEFREKLIDLMIAECVKVLSEKSIFKRKDKTIEQILNEHFKVKTHDVYEDDE